MSRFWFAALGSLSVLGGCQESVPRPDVIAEIEDERLVFEEFESFLARSAFDPDTVLDSSVLSALLDQMLDESLLRRLARTTLLVDTPISDPDPVELLLEHADLPPISEAAIASYYRLNIDRFERPERVYLRQILLADPVAASDIRQVWALGAAYEEIVDRLARVQGAYVGQEGEFTQGELPLAFAEMLFSLESGSVTSVLATDYGYHVFQVVEHLPANIVELDLARDQIRRTLDDERMKNELYRLVETARERYNVRVFARNLPFNYEGRYESHTSTNTD